MPRTAITVITSSRAGSAEIFTAADAANDMTFDNSSQNVMLIIKNDGASPVTPTFITPQTIDTDLAVGDRAGTTCAAGETRAYGPFKNSLYGNAGNVDVDLDNDTTVEVAAVAMGAI